MTSAAKRRARRSAAAAATAARPGRIAVNPGYGIMPDGTVVPPRPTPLADIVAARAAIRAVTRSPAEQGGTDATH